MRVLVACEESQTICKAFRERGHEAYSCDIQPCSGGHPEWHIQGDVLEILNDDWDLIIAHPPCTYLSKVGNRGFSLRVTPADKVVDKWEKRALASVFFMQCALAPCEKICIENPAGFMSRAWRKPDQYIDPWMFASGPDDKENYHAKKTGLWLKGLPKLVGNGNVITFDNKRYGQYSSGKWKTWEDVYHGSKVRSKTFPGIAKAMAEQWG